MPFWDQWVKSQGHRNSQSLGKRCTVTGAPMVLFHSNLVIVSSPRTTKHCVQCSCMRAPKVKGQSRDIDMSLCASQAQWCTHLRTQCTSQVDEYLWCTYVLQEAWHLYLLQVYWCGCFAILSILNIDRHTRLRNIALPHLAKSVDSSAIVFLIQTDQLRKHATSIGRRGLQIEGTRTYLDICCNPSLLYANVQLTTQQSKIVSPVIN